jgi:hypothetical protein
MEFLPTAPQLPFALKRNAVLTFQVETSVSSQTSPLSGNRDRVTTPLTVEAFLYIQPQSKAAKLYAGLAEQDDILKGFILPGQSLPPLAPGSEAAIERFDLEGTSVDFAIQGDFTVESVGHPFQSSISAAIGVPITGVFRFLGSGSILGKSS